MAGDRYVDKLPYSFLSASQPSWLLGAAPNLASLGKPDWGGEGGGNVAEMRHARRRREGNGRSWPDASAAAPDPVECSGCPATGRWRARRLAGPTLKEKSVAGQRRRRARRSAPSAPSSPLTRWVPRQQTNNTTQFTGPAMPGGEEGGRAEAPGHLRVSTNSSGRDGSSMC